jgi:nicotinamide riboside kinase
VTLKVIVTGAYSTGKTTFVRSLERSLKATGKTFAVLDEVSRICPFPLNREQTGQSNIWLATTQISRELHAASTGTDIILCDRGIPDILAHMFERNSSADPMLLELTRFLESWCGTYDLFLATTIDPEIAPIPDGIREPDPAYREKLHRAAEAILDRYVNVEWLPLGLDRRTAYALTLIGRLVS